MKVLLGHENPDAEKLLPPARDDGSGVGINYADAYLKTIKVTTEDGRKVFAKRRGLKITFTIEEGKVAAMIIGPPSPANTFTKQ